MPFSGERRPTKSTCGGSSGSPTDSGISTPVGTTRTSRAPSSRAAPARYSEATIASRARRRIGRKSHGAFRASSTSVPQSWTTYGFPVASAASAGRQPVRVDEVGVPRRPARRPRVVEEERRQQQREPRPPAQVAGDPVPVGDPEVPERRRRDDLDLDALRPHRLDRVADEEAGHVPLVARVRGRQDDDLHVSRRANTIGAASASSANAKK